jgi:hypothetical protein
MTEPLPYPPPPDQPPAPEEAPAVEPSAAAPPAAEPEQAATQPAAEQAAAAPVAVATPELPLRTDPQLPAPLPPPYPAYQAPPPPYPAYQAPPPPYPAYQAPPPPYSPYQAPAPAYGSPPPAAYGAPPYGGYAPPYGYSATGRRLGRRAWMAITAGIVVAVLLLAVAGYGIAGYLVAQNEISIGSNAINTASSHRSAINGSFDSISQQIIALDLQGSAIAGKSASNQILSQAQSMATPIAGNAQSLRTAQLKLNDLSWLTAFSRGSLQDESTRLDHARKAVGDVQTAADDYTQLGRFLQSYYQAFVDLDNMSAATDATGFVTAFNALRSDLASGLQLAISVPGLPTQFHDFLSALQSQANDLRQEEIAAAAGDQAGATAAKNALTADTQKADAVDFSGTNAAVHTYYQRFRDDFNSQLDQATV